MEANKIQIGVLQLKGLDYHALILHGTTIRRLFPGSR